MNYSCRWTAGHCATLAATLEASIPKAGNVHRGADFSDTSFYDFLWASGVLGNVIDTHREKGVGETIHAAVGETQKSCRGNPNLGIVLLTVPMAKSIQRYSELTTESMARVLQEISPGDSRMVYKAIQLASPGGLGNVAEQDVMACENPDLMKGMEIAASRDFVAHQYANDFREVIIEIAPEIARSQAEFGSLEKAVVITQIRYLARKGDSLIFRKLGAEADKLTRCLASRAADFLPDDWNGFESAVGELDFWMRSDGNRRNPGAVADLIAAALMVCLWNGTVNQTVNGT